MSTLFAYAIALGGGGFRRLPKAPAGLDRDSGTGVFLERNHARLLAGDVGLLWALFGDMGGLPLLDRVGGAFFGCGSWVLHSP